MLPQVNQLLHQSLPDSSVPRRSRDISESLHKAYTSELWLDFYCGHMWPAVVYPVDGWTSGRPGICEPIVFIIWSSDLSCVDHWRSDWGQPRGLSTTSLKEALCPFRFRSSWPEKSLFSRHDEITASLTSAITWPAGSCTHCRHIINNTACKCCHTTAVTICLCCSKDNTFCSSTSVLWRPIRAPEWFGWFLPQLSAAAAAEHVNTSYGFPSTLLPIYGE